MGIRVTRRKEEEPREDSGNQRAEREKLKSIEERAVVRPNSESEQKREEEYQQQEIGLDQTALLHKEDTHCANQRLPHKGYQLPKVGSRRVSIE